MRKLRHNKVKCFPPVHTARKEQIQEVNPGSVAQNCILNLCALFYVIFLKTNSGITSILWMMRLREIIQFGQGYTALQWWSQVPKPRCVIQRFSAILDPSQWINKPKERRLFKHPG